MKIKSKIIMIIFSMIMGTITFHTNCFAADEPVTTQTKPKVLNKFLQFILKAKSGAVVKNDQAYYLKLQGVEGSVIYFTNRPRRIANTMTTGFFLKRWTKPPPHAFTSDPPNAAVIYLNKKAKQQGM